ncbi:diguanylate cyclase [Paraburkholderia strydomiana]|uniref:GGDEF domain-containing protein n=1 Tax=Paraburkholderia strydomiana TaxID=1245417 RepID=UPI0038B9CD14
MTSTGKQSAALGADFLRHELQEAAPRATGVEGYMEHDAAVYRTLLESTRAIPWKIDWASMEFAYVGPQIEALLGWAPSSWKNVQDWAARMHPEDRDKVVEFCVAQSKAGTDHEADYRALTSRGEYVWLRDVVHVVRDERGEVSALVGFMFDISERKKTEEKLAALQRELEALSFKDGLTSVGNRREFDAVLQREWSAAQRHGSPLSLIMVDVDFFKSYNDYYGHVQGDACLKRIAGVLSDAAREAAERCRGLIGAAKIPHERSPFRQTVTASFGVGSVIPAEAGDPLAFVNFVDTQLYRAKDNGRDCIAAGKPAG